MGRDTKKDRKRRVEDDSDDDRDRRRERDRRSRSISPPKEKRRHKSKSRSRSPEVESKGGGASESLSIAETNKLRAQLGLAPLELDDGPKVRDSEDGNTTDKIVKEDGMEFRHRKAENWGDKKKDADIKDKIETARKKREVYSKVLKTKGLAADDSDDDAAGWVNKLRKQEEEKKKAEERAKMLDAMDEEFGVNSIIEDEKAKQSRKKARESAKKRAAERAATGGLVVGHGKEVFLSGQDQILVLEDKSVLDDGDEVLVNPNLIDAEKTARNVELKKRKGQRQFDEDLDEWGNPRDHGLLAKYDEELEGEKKDTFRLDDRGNVDLEREREEEAMRRRLMMAGKTLVSLDDSSKFNRASEFYTNEEMVAFRKVKKEKKERKIRKRKEKGGMLKADDLIPDEPSGGGGNLGSRNRRRRELEDDDAMETAESEVKQEIKLETEDGEIDEDTPGGLRGKWKKTTQGAVDLDALKKVVEKEIEEYNEDSDDELVPGVDLTDVILDDDAEDELASIIDKARRLKQKEAHKVILDPEAVARKVHEQVNRYDDVKMEVDNEGKPVKEELEDGVVMIDSTMEYCRNIGEIPTYGLAGNRLDAIDTEEIDMDKEDDDEVMAERIREVKDEKKRREKASREAKGGWMEASTSVARGIDSDDEEALREAHRFRGSDSEGEESDSEDQKGPHDVLGEEADVTKGVGAMLKLASKKGYLHDPNASKHTGDSLEHLKNKRFTQMESAKYDIEEKYTKKLEKMGTTGRGPTMDFAEKKNYTPDINIMYVDEKGRELDSKDAFRKLSWKFHGKNPGKKQLEKRSRRIDQKEMLKKFTSSDTPLGTLSRQLKKQEQLQTPYLVLSGNASHSNFKKE